jgi:puromycin-sensitive aminopeptidase
MALPMHKTLRDVVMAAHPRVRTVSDTTTAPTDAADPYRLPRGVVPSHYDLTLTPDLAAATFTGACVTTVTISGAVRDIVCNAVDLHIDEAWLEGPHGTRVEVETHFDADHERLRFTLLDHAVAGPGQWTLHTVFRGELNDQLHGFYRSTFTDTDGVEQTIATTQFEATHARRAFPCWDEPDFKATFGVTLVVDDHLAAISNAAEVSRTPAGDGLVAVRFADTMVMSTYLVAFVVGPFEATDPVDVDGTPLRVVYPRGKGHLAAYALEVGEFCLRFFADYYAIGYPGDKLDLVAVPDFAFGAMENLGCVTFREVLLLVDPTSATQPELERLTDVIAHELAHMWFGDLVTMKWWNGIWLNEAFATFMEMLATDAFRPEWDRWSTFGLSRTMAFDVDGCYSTRPIEYPVVSPDDAEGMFDILTYEKGAAVVRMLEQYLGAEVFRDGIRQYLATHAYANTETTDLWDALETASGQPVRSMMDTWIFQGGFPLIDVELLNDQIDLTAPTTVRFRQQRFTYAGDVVDGQADTRWIVPLIFSVRLGSAITFERVLLDGDEVDVELPESVEWVLANTESTGFYRSAHSPLLLDAIAAHATTDLSPIERYQVLDDAWALVLADKLAAADFFDLTLRLAATETDLSVWNRIVGGLSAIDRLVDGDARAALEAHIRSALRPPLDALGLERRAGDDDRTRELRGTLLNALGTLGRDPQAITDAERLYADDDTDPSVAAAAAAILAATGDGTRFEQFLERYRQAATPQEELRFLSVLADFTDGELVDRVLAMTLDEIRSQNVALLLRRALTNREQGPRAWRFVAGNWDALNDRLPSNSIVRMCEGIRSLSWPEVADEVFAFFETHEIPQGDKPLAQHLERLGVNVALRARESENLRHHLAG